MAAILGHPNRVYLNDGTGHLEPGPTFGEVGSQTRDVAIADLNADGLLDIVQANDCGINEVFFQTGSDR